MSECLHGLEADWCATCKHGNEREPTPTIVATFAAKFDGDCRSCSLPIHVGQVIHKLSDERYVHEGCCL